MKRRIEQNINGFINSISEREIKENGQLREKIKFLKRYLGSWGGHAEEQPDQEDLVDFGYQYLNFAI